MDQEKIEVASIIHTKHTFSASTLTLARSATIHHLLVTANAIIVQIIVNRMIACLSVDATSSAQKVQMADGVNENIPWAFGSGTISHKRRGEVVESESS